MGEFEVPKQKPRPLMRLGMLLMKHRVIFSVLCCVAGVIALLLLPVLAKSTYISENALMPGSANPMLSPQDAADASKLVADILSLEEETSGLESPRILAQLISRLGAEVSQFDFYPEPKKFNPLHFFSNPGHEMIQDKINCTSPAVSTIGIIRAPRGDGKEAIVLVTPYNAAKTEFGEALSVGVAYSVFSLLSRVTWLAKDIIWVAADSRYGEYDSVAAWLKDYFSPSLGGSEARGMSCSAANDLNELKQNLTIGRAAANDFRRAGTMAASLVIKVVNGYKEGEDTLSIYAEASNGQMPNLDLINVVNYLAVHRLGLRVKVEKLWHLLDSKFLKFFGEIFEFLGKVAKTLNPQWKFGIPVAEYIEGTATLASSLYAQALGVPTGPHGPFRDYQIDAVTLVISPKVLAYNNKKRVEFLLRNGQLIEGVIRSVNNLLEKFHQSFFLYLLTGPSKFVSVGVYMIAFALLVAPLPVVAASLYTDAFSSDLTSDSPVPLRSWKWLNAAKSVFFIHLWGLIVAFLPYFISQLSNLTPTTSFLSWVSLSSISLHILYFLFGSPSNSRASWAMLKSMMLSSAFIGLSLMSVVNFATAELGALLLVPFCLMAQPFKLDLRARTVKTLARVVCNWVFAFIGFPLTAFFMLRGMSEGFVGIDVGEFWNWVESLWVWNSATYLYVSLVHLPCWVMCIHILFYPC